MCGTEICQSLVYRKWEQLYPAKKDKNMHMYDTNLLRTCLPNPTSE